METMEEYLQLCEEITTEETVGRPTYELAEEYADAWFIFD